MIDAMIASGYGVIGTPDDAIAQIERLVEAVGRLRRRTSSWRTTGPTARRRCARTSCSRAT